MGPLVALAIVVAAYLLGSIPTAYLFARLTRRIDIRRVGSGNVGALNTFKEVGPAAGTIVLLADALKGVLAAFMPELPGLPEELLYFTAVAVVAGHNWPLFLGFRGGKGAATVAGLSLVALPWLTLIAVGVTLAVALVARHAVVGIVSGFAFLNLLIIATGQEWGQVGLCLFLSLVVAATYLGGSWKQTVASLRHRRWVDLFSFE